MGSVEKPGIRNAWPVGFGFRPTDDELINHHLKRKLHGLEEEAGRVIPELDIYRWEPHTLFEKYNAMSDYLSDGGECFFYCVRDGKNRKTPTGFWKETRKKRTFLGCDGEENRSKRIFVYHKGRQPYGRKSSFSMHEYHLNCCTEPTIGADQGPAMELVLCRIINRKVKQINLDSPSECIDPDPVTPGGTTVNQGDKEIEASPPVSMVCDPQQNLTEAEAEAEAFDPQQNLTKAEAEELAGHGDSSGKESESTFIEPHQYSFNDPFDNPVNYGDYDPDDGVFISDLWGLAETQFSGSISDMGDFGVA